MASLRHSSNRNDSVDRTICPTCGRKTTDSAAPAIVDQFGHANDSEPAPDASRPSRVPHTSIPKLPKPNSVPPSGTNDQFRRERRRLVTRLKERIVDSTISQLVTVVVAFVLGLAGYGATETYNFVMDSENRKEIRLFAKQGIQSSLEVKVRINKDLQATVSHILWPLTTQAELLLDNISAELPPVDLILSGMTLTGPPTAIETVKVELSPLLNDTLATNFYATFKVVSPADRIAPDTAAILISIFVSFGERSANLQTMSEHDLTPRHWAIIAGFYLDGMTKTIDRSNPAHVKKYEEARIAFNRFVDKHGWYHSLRRANVLHGNDSIAACTYAPGFTDIYAEH